MLREIPQTFVHRDFHSRNLLVTDINNPGVIDYQDAVIGPITYDLVSLLKDCYVTWDDGLIEDMLESFFTRIKSNNINNISDFRYWFDMTGLQRHIKAIGIFSRLNYRDNKDNYLKDIPRTYTYIEKTLNKYNDLTDFNEIFRDLDLLEDFKMKVIILSSGKGTRMMPLTKDTPKPMLGNQWRIFT